MFNLLKFMSFGLVLFVFQFKAFCMKDIQQTVAKTKLETQQQIVPGLSNNPNSQEFNQELFEETQKLLDLFSIRISLEEQEIACLHKSLEIKEKIIASLKKSLEKKDQHIIQLLSFIDSYGKLAKRKQEKENFLMSLLENICNSPQNIL